MEVEKISEMFIKPSSPTPPHLKSYKVSLLDQLSEPSLVIPVILYYPNQDNNVCSKMSMLLKQSLSEALTLYYPLAGRTKGNVSIDCNDEGVCYVEAKANISLAEHLKQPDLQSMNALSPRNNWYVLRPTGTNPLMIQETRFACGGITICVLVSHMAMDGIAVASFINCWAAIARNSTRDIIPPNFDGPSIFPQDESFPEDLILSFYKPIFRSGKSSSRRFVFDASSIDKLEAETTTSSNVKNLTRIEVVSALLLKCIAAVLKERSSGINRPLVFTQAVNLRKKITPQLPQNSLGNFLCFGRALCSPEEIKIPDLAYKQREAIRSVDSASVKNLQSGGFNMLRESLKEVFDPIQSSTVAEIGMNCVGISSWCNFGLDEADFGWGKPAWVAGIPSPNSAAPFLNIILLMDAVIDKGIEAWVLLDEEESLLLEKDKHLLQYASLNPSPLNHKEYPYAKL